jgi:hypothetical protein
MVPNVNERVKIDMQMQLDLFENARGLFGMESAVLTRLRNHQVNICTEATTSSVCCS